MRDYALKVEMRPNYPPSYKEVILGPTLPPNVIPFKDYVAKRNRELSLHITPKLRRSQWEKDHISRLYRLLVLPYFPKAGKITLDHYHLFLHYTLPFVVRNCVFDGINGVCNAFYHRNKAFLLKCGIRYATFKKRTMAIMVNCSVPDVPDHPRIKKFLHREALRIVWALAGYKGHENASEGCFFVSGRDLAARLFTRHRSTPERILKKFCEWGILEVTNHGIDRRMAKLLGEKPRATSYRLLLSHE